MGKILNFKYSSVNEFIKRNPFIKNVVFTQARFHVRNICKKES